MQTLIQPVKNEPSKVKSKEEFMKRILIVAILSVSLVFLGCAGMTDTQQRTLSGGAMGAGAGAIVGAIAGSAGWGAAIGAATGIVGGYIYDQHEKSKQKSYQEGYKAGQQTQPSK